MTNFHFTCKFNLEFNSYKKNTNSHFISKEIFISFLRNSIKNL